MIQELNALVFSELTIDIGHLIPAILVITCNINIFDRASLVALRRTSVHNTETKYKNCILYSALIINIITFYSKTSSNFPPIINYPSYFSARYSIRSGYSTQLQNNEHYIIREYTPNGSLDNYMLVIEGMMTTVHETLLQDSKYRKISIICFIGLSNNFTGPLIKNRIADERFVNMKKIIVKLSINLVLYLTRTLDALICTQHAKQRGGEIIIEHSTVVSVSNNV